MQEIDIFDEVMLSRQLEVQKSKGWDLDKDLNWSGGVDLSKSLLPLNQNNMLFPNATSEQKLVISQLMGLIVASSIAQLEQVANDLKEPTWNRFLRKYPVNPELFELGEHFYEDEMKHSMAFNRYIDSFAAQVNVDPSDLRQFLPQANNSIATQIYKLNSLAGGMAIWWLIAAVEEESILIYKYMKGMKGSVDPLYYQLHKLHFEEEVRHKSYAFMMLKVHEEFSNTPQSLLLKKLDFIIAEVLNLTWTFNQLFKIRNFKKFENHHPFFKTLASLEGMLGQRNPLEIINCLFKDTPYISSALHMSEQKHVKELLDRFGVPSIPLSKTKTVGELCTA
ncbi:hypothetical protein A9Q84_00515 [Halobacteriovorax marinus]|uniref:Uncharacterized protein n=1 Tax=Halobacteriovorax marinus TaxID=97084 RepID=A0A1Y5FH60_9BACT|nr:hypothetical protein A9Q84_00515 [Halobacteriovorax marinus]